MTTSATVPLSSARNSEMTAVLAALERIEARLSRLEALAPPAIGAAATLVDTIDQRVAALRDRGIDIEERAGALARAVEKLTDPRVLAALESLATLAAQGPDVLATLVDALDSRMTVLAAKGIDVGERATLLFDALERLTSPEALSVLKLLLSKVDDVRFLLESGVLERHTVSVVAELGRALADTARSETRGVGLFGALSAMGDARVQRALGFGLSLASRFGDALRKTNGARASLEAGAKR
jgi:uncharacterized protein YjgD (DUF1641 family)